MAHTFADCFARVEQGLCEGFPEGGVLEQPLHRVVADLVRDWPLARRQRVLLLLIVVLSFVFCMLG